MTRLPSSITAYSGVNGGNMNRLKLAAGVLLIFLTGIAAGHLGTVFYFENKIYTQGPPPLHHLIKKRVSHELQLSDQQQIQFENIIGQAEKNLDAFRQAHHPELEKILTDCFQKINVILTPDQQTKFEKIKNRFTHRFHGPKKFSSCRHFNEPPFPESDELKEALNLNENQINNLRPIIREFNRELKNNFSDDRPRDMHGPENFKNKTQPGEDDLISRIKPYLDDSQLLKLKDLLKSRHPSCLPGRDEH